MCENDYKSISEHMWYKLTQTQSIMCESLFISRGKQYWPQRQQHYQKHRGHETLHDWKQNLAQVHFTGLVDQVVMWSGRRGCWVRGSADRRMISQSREQPRIQLKHAAAARHTRSYRSTAHGSSCNTHYWEKAWDCMCKSVYIWDCLFHFIHL